MPILTQNAEGTVKLSLSNSHIDCVLVGHNQMRFDEYARTLWSMGERTGAYRDVRLSYYPHNGQIITCREFCNRRLEATQCADDMSYDDMLSATISYLGSFLNKQGLTFDYVNSFQEGKAELACLLTQSRVEMVAITTTYYVSSFPLMEIIDFIRSLNTPVKIVVGGPFIHTQYRVHDESSFRLLLSDIQADFYIINAQGERTLVDLLRAVKTDSCYESIPNLAYRRGDTYRWNMVVEESNDLGANMVNWRLFRSIAQRRTRRMVMVWTSRSCPFSCSFCSFPAHAGAYRYLSPEEVWKDLDEIEALGYVTSVTFIDDTFNVPLNRYRQIISGLAQRKYSFRWNCNFRCQYATEEVVELMKEGGCDGVFLGLESGSDPILNNMNKQVTTEAYRRGIKLLKQAGILTHASFIVGFPGETPDTVRETKDFIETTAPDFFRAQLWYYDTLTPIHREAAKYGLRNSQFEWTHNSMRAEEAANWVDDLHRSVKSSIWLPQNDFDFPSIFCLLDRGWTATKIKDALRVFNQKVVQGLSKEERGNIPIDIQNELLRSSEFGF